MRRGGLRGDILTEGEIRVGDNVMEIPEIDTAAVAVGEDRARIRAVVHAAARPVLGAYSQAIVAGDLVYVSGAAPPPEPDTGELAEELWEQTDALLKNLEQVLEAAGTTLRRVVEVTVYLTDPGKRRV